jgi:hopanoid C-2 methylase
MNVDTPELSASSLLSFNPNNRRRILLIFPQYSNSFGTFNHAFPLVGVKAFMPPQGILLIASLLPKKWEIRWVDENIRPASQEDFEWCDVVFMSGMHIQREKILDINWRAHLAEKVTVLGGPSVSAASEYYPDVDLLHCGEVGDGTLRLFEHLDRTIQRPENQITFRTIDRLPMTQFPSPAYHLLDLTEYLLGSIQFSSGCPFTCEFCDIPGLYGRNPRLKTPQQIIAELDELAAGGVDAVYFVDDNFIGNPKATLELLPHLVEWQKKHDYYIGLSCEATLNISTHPKILELMRQSLFTTVFCGIETPEPGALKAIKKGQNLRTPILESVEILNSFGMEVASGIILGFDTDTSETPQAIIDFAEASQVPIMTVNLLYALPHTPLHQRMEKAGRLVSNEGRDSNIDFLIPYEEVVARWKRVVETIYDPKHIFARFATQAAKTYPHREKSKEPWKRATLPNLKRAFATLSRIMWRVGVLSNYRREFWRMAWRELKKGNIEMIFQISLVSHHLITYARECIEGKMQSSNYSPRVITEEKASREKNLQIDLQESGYLVSQ